MDSSNDNPCFQCKGNGVVSKKIRNELWKNENQTKYIQEERCCPSCEGSGFIRRSRRKNDDGSYRKKKVVRSYPSFETIGPIPACEGTLESHLQSKDDEELSYLIGHWKIFQKLDRHRYSTDDLCTSYYACKTLKEMQIENPLILDIGCGLGSVLLTNAWQFPSSTCIGIEAQKDRYELALRSVEYNIGSDSGSVDSRIQVYNEDLRNTSSSKAKTIATTNPNGYGYDLITGTPPYFPANTGATPICYESSGCLFELRGGVEDYCKTASQYLRRPTNGNIKPSIFTVCNTALASARTYSGCNKNGLSVIKRIDVIPKHGKPPLFSVFIIVANEWIESDLLNEHRQFPNLTSPAFSKSLSEVESQGEGDDVDINTNTLPLDHTVCKNEYRIPEDKSLYGEIVEKLVVRDCENCHTIAYQTLLQHLGKPSSVNKEVYDVDVGVGVGVDVGVGVGVDVGVDVGRRCQK